MTKGDVRVLRNMARFALTVGINAVRIAWRLS